MKTKWFTALAMAALLMGASGGVLRSQAKADQDSKQPAAHAPTRIRVGGKVMEAKLIHKVQPKYPPMAKKRGITGVVKMQAEVDKDGEVAEVKLLSGDPILAESAMKAVRKWRYQTTLLNGRPVAVLTQIDVNFTLRE